MIEFQYFEGCPNSAQTLINLRELIKENKLLDQEIIITEVSDLDTSERVHFQGSPSILYNGVDIYTGNKPDKFSYTCRIYNINGEKTGILSKDYILERIKYYRRIGT